MFLCSLMATARGLAHTPAEVALRPWVINFPVALRFLFATRPRAMGKVPGIVHRTSATHLLHKAGYHRKDAHIGAVQRLSPSPHGKAVFILKAPYRDGTTQIVFEPVDIAARLAALVPRPHVILTRYHGVPAPNHHWRAEITPAGRGNGALRRHMARPNHPSSAMPR